ncbi:uncharacterized protein, partial [Halyomorpha halys]|uniref:uncharacterized protein n=1 Tax=Halyomorpha halys TaxID=286706 RepID=UPI0034D26495
MYYYVGAVARSASPQDDDDSLDTDGFQEQFLLGTPTPIEEPIARPLAFPLPFSPEQEKGTKDSKYREYPKFSDIDKTKNVKRLLGGVGDGEKRVNWGEDDDKKKQNEDKGTSPPPDGNFKQKEGQVPAIELIIGRKEVHTKEASASSESKLTLYTATDLEISIRSQSHISLTTTSGKKTSHTVDFDTTFETAKDETENFEEYIIPKEKKKEETVFFSGKKSIYRYDSQTSPGFEESPISEESISHHITDTGISLTRGTVSDTSMAQVAASSGIKLVSDTLVNSEEAELTDAGLSPIQADDIGIHQTDIQFIEEEIKKYTDKASSPIQLSTETVALSPLQVPVTEMSVSTDSVNTCDASVSPIRPEEIVFQSQSVPEPKKDVFEEMISKKSGEVKAIIKLIEEHTQKVEETKQKTESSKESPHVTPTHTKQVVASKIKELQKVFTPPVEKESVQYLEKDTISEGTNITIQEKLSELVNLQAGILSSMTVKKDEDQESIAHSLESQPDLSISDYDIITESVFIEDSFKKKKIAKEKEFSIPIDDKMLKQEITKKDEVKKYQARELILTKSVKDFIDEEMTECTDKIKSKFDYEDSEKNNFAIEEVCKKKTMDKDLLEQDKFFIQHRKVKQHKDYSEISETDVSALMSEVQEFTRQIKQEVKKLKPDLTPTPEGKDIPTAEHPFSVEISSILEEKEESQKDIYFKEMETMLGKENEQMYKIVNKIQETVSAITPYDTGEKGEIEDLKISRHEEKIGPDEQKITDIAPTKHLTLLEHKHEIKESQSQKYIKDIYPPKISTRETKQIDDENDSIQQDRHKQKTITADPMQTIINQLDIPFSFSLKTTKAEKASPTPPKSPLVAAKDEITTIISKEVTTKIITTTETLPSDEIKEEL